jgi:hypothetical protein
MPHLAGTLPACNRENAMTATTEFYASQADACARAASESDLPMLREKYEQAGAAWRSLANRESEIAAARDRRLAETAARAELAQPRQT